MIAHAHHIQEERLVDCYFAERSGELPDPPVVDHLEECPQCGERYSELTRFMDEARHEADLRATPCSLPSVCRRSSSTSRTGSNTSAVRRASSASRGGSSPGA